jgi:hypothetical protein
VQLSLEKVIEKSNEEKENKEYNLKGFKTWQQNVFGTSNVSYKLCFLNVESYSRRIPAIRIFSTSFKQNQTSG